MKKKIVVTGGSGRFGQCLKNFETNHKMLFPTKKELDILNFKSLSKFLGLFTSSMGKILKFFKKLNLLFLINK